VQPGRFGGGRRRFLLLLLTAMILGAMAGSLLRGDQESRDLKKRHKAQMKTLKIQQRGMKKAMRVHPVSREESKRFKRELKMQKLMLKNGQKDETSSLKERRKFNKRVHPELPTTIQVQ
jgi:hypothetical protein